MKKRTNESMNLYYNKVSVCIDNDQKHKQTTTKNTHTQQNLLNEFEKTQ